MNWEIKYLPNPRKTLDKIDYDTKIKIIGYFKKLSLAEDPTSFGKPLTNNLKGFWRYRVGDYRIICDIRKKELIILVIDIGHRSKIYKN